MYHSDSNGNLSALKNLNELTGDENENLEKGSYIHCNEKDCWKLDEEAWLKITPKNNDLKKVFVKKPSMPISFSKTREENTLLKNNKKKEKIETNGLSTKGDIAFTSFRKTIVKNHVIDVEDILEMNGEIQRQWDKMKDMEKERFLLYTPKSRREREYCICRKRYNKNQPSSPIVACNICPEWYHVECIEFSYSSCTRSTILLVPQLC